MLYVCNVDFYGLGVGDIFSRSGGQIKVRPDRQVLATPSKKREKDDPPDGKKKKKARAKSESLNGQTIARETKEEERGNKGE